jgi:hypothetical protein
MNDEGIQLLIMRRITTSSVVFLLTFIIGVAIGLGYVLSGYGWVREQWETSNGAFKIRVQNYASFPFFVSSYYVFRTSPAGSDSWREVTAHAYDGFEGTIPMSRNQVRFVNSRVGYYYIYSTVAVTVDGGNTWSIWQPEEWFIEDVDINGDGTGWANLKKYDYQLGGWIGSYARTKNYGQAWSIE